MYLSLIQYQKKLSELDTYNYLLHLNYIVRFWNDHDSGVQTWNNVKVTTLTATGTTTNDNAVSGNLGEYISSTVARGAAVTGAANGTYKDLTSIVLTAGDWDISIIGGVIPATTQTGYEIGIGTTTGNSAAGMAYGDNLLQINTTGLGAALDDGMSIPSWRVSIASSTTYFYKILGYYSVGTPQFYGRISARRVR